MDSAYIKEKKAEIIALGREMWSLGLVTGWSGNISVRVAADTVLLTGKGTSLGRLQEEQISVVDLEGEPIEGAAPSSEYRLHVDIYKSMPDISTIVHTHTVYTNAFFLDHDVFHAETFEGEFVLGEVFGVPQASINVEETMPVVERLKTSRIVALRRHGVVAIGDDLFDCMARIQILEEQVKMQAMKKVFSLKT